MMKVYAEPTGGRGGRPTGNRANGPVGGQGAYYRRVGVTTMGGNSRTKGRPRQVQRVPQRGEPGYAGGNTRG